jgi:hypothetical protein
MRRMPLRRGTFNRDCHVDFLGVPEILHFRKSHETDEMPRVNVHDYSDIRGWAVVDPEKHDRLNSGAICLRDCTCTYNQFQER